MIAIAAHDCPVANLRVQVLGGQLGPVLVEEPEADAQRQDPPDDQRVGPIT